MRILKLARDSGTTILGFSRVPRSHAAQGNEAASGAGFGGALTAGLLWSMAGVAWVLS